MRDVFARFAHWTSNAVGTPWAFLTALAVVLMWAASGPLFHFTDTWQLVINTSTTIVTFLMVFLIQGAQNRDAQAMHTKLDAIALALDGVSNRVVGLEEQTEQEADAVRREIQGGNR